MSRSKRFTPRSNASPAGFSSLELLLAVTMTTIAVAATSSYFQASRRFLRNQALQIETTHAARSALDMMVRDLRLGGACLPATGDFISLEGVSGGAEDTITTRTGLTRPDLSCVRTSTPIGVVTPAEGNTITVESTDGFSTGMRAYMRGAVDGEFFYVTSVDAQNKLLGRDRAFTQDYPEGSGVYAIDERRFFISHTAGPSPDTPALMLQVAEDPAQAFAVGIEQLTVEYQLERNCPPCDRVPVPASDDEWRLVQELLVTVTARSERTNDDGQYYRRVMQVGVKPRNLIPQ